MTTPLANLTRDDARRRAAAITSVDYTLHLEFALAATGYRGRCLIAFACARADADLFVDFVGRAIESAELNGHALPAGARQGPRLMLPAALLTTGRNRLAVEYACDYDLESVGLHHFTDPADGGEYLYTDFEPHDANRVFPCFDQPDLKATFQVSVLAPTGWEVVSNTAVESRREVDDRTFWQFGPTPRMSTYLMNVSAGNYQVWEDPEARIPSRLLARRSLAPHVDAAELSRITRAGFDFYERYFEIPYPFGKYDQIFVPEFKTGAMENVGAVVITDSVLFRHRPTAEERVDRAILLLHEMAHMWFGNLVTMRWWDGLWLNESFATYMSFLAAEACTDYREIWQFFDARLRRWAVWQDELSSTHPIEMDVPETAGCFNNFDGITYGKGCCVLKQLVFRLGAEPFRKGVAAYLKKYAWQNTENLDFIRALSEAAGADLTKWEEAWLHASGVNTLACEVAEAGGRLTALAVRQSRGNGDARLKEHRVRLGFFADSAAGLTVERTLEVTLDGERTAVAGAAGLAAPAFLHPNLGFEAYAKTTLDARSLACAEAGLARFTDAGVRSGVVDILGGMLMDAELPAGRFVTIVSGLLPGEPSSQILDVLSRRVVLALSEHLPRERRAAPAARIFAMAAQEAARAGAPAGVRRIWFRFMAGTALEAEAHERLRALLAGREALGDLELDQEMRWDLVAQLARFDAEPGLLAAEEARDRTDRGARRAEVVRASFPDAAVKQRSWERFLTDRQTSLELLKRGFSGFVQAGQEAVLAPYTAAYLEALPRVAAERSMEFAMAFAEDLFPAYEEAAGFRDQLEQLIRGGTIPSALGRIVAEQRDDLVRLQRIRARARE